MARRNRSPEENERRAKIRELLQLGNIGSRDAAPGYSMIARTQTTAGGIVRSGIPDSPKKPDVLRVSPQDIRLSSWSE